MRPIPLPPVAQKTSFLLVPVELLQSSYGFLVYRFIIPDRQISAYCPVPVFGSIPDHSHMDFFHVFPLCHCCLASQVWIFVKFSETLQGHSVSSRLWVFAKFLLVNPMWIPWLLSPQHSRKLVITRTLWPLETSPWDLQGHSAPETKRTGCQKWRQNEITHEDKDKDKNKISIGANQETS